MTTTDYPWEPPLAGTEAEHLVGALDRLRATFRWKADDLDVAGLQTRIGASSLTLGGLLKHLALVEDHSSTTKLNGEPPGAPWEAVDWDADPDWEFTSAAGDTPEQLYALWDDAVERSRARFDAALADGGLDQLVHVSWPDGRHASLRRLVCDLIEEYGRHTGHADLLREAVDGRVGEDPPAGWHAHASPSRQSD
ncbi:MAG: mycothiol transferase [Nocardioidaceae bacterium]